MKFHAFFLAFVLAASQLPALNVFKEQEIQRKRDIQIKAAVNLVAKWTPTFTATATPGAKVSPSVTPTFTPTPKTSPTPTPNLTPKP